MKISEIHEYLNQFPKSVTSTKGLGCYDEAIIKTGTVSTVSSMQHYGGKACKPEEVVETHYKQIIKAIENHPGDVVYVRSMPQLVELLNEEGEFEGHYMMKTRLQFGKPGLCITTEQYQNLLDLGWMTP